MLPDIGVKRRKGRKSGQKSRSTRASTGATAMMDPSSCQCLPLSKSNSERRLSRYTTHSPRACSSPGSMCCLHPTNDRGRRVGTSMVASGVHFSMVRPILSKLTCFVAGSACPCVNPGQAVHFTCSSHVKMRYRAVMSGRHIRCNRCREFQFRLRRTNPTSRLDLKPLIDAIYMSFRYAIDISTMARAVTFRRLDYQKRRAGTT